MLERIWRKGNPLELLVGIQIDTATVGTVWGFLKRLGTKLSYDLEFFDFFKSTKIYFFTVLYLFSILNLKSIYLKTEPLALDFPGSSAGKKIHLQCRRPHLDYWVRKIPWRRGGSDGKESASSVGYMGSIAGLGRSPGGGHSNPLQYACLEIPMDRGAWWAAVYGVAKNQTRMSD